MKKLIFFFLFFLLNFQNSFSSINPSPHFPVDSGMKVRIGFWKKVFVEISSREGFIHDTNDLSLIYKKINIKNMKRRKRVRYVRAQKREVISLIRGIILKKGLSLNEKEKKLYENIGRPPIHKLSTLRRRVRFQRGMSDRYLKGLERSSYYLDWIKKEFISQGIPEDLAYLPHVESSFNFLAYSKVGAAGMWQFMRSTARIYKLKMNYLIDERRDPKLSTKAAAKLLKTNFKKLGAWPLAITAYNHGAKSLLRAIRQLKTHDIGVIVEGYQGRRFGFASKNFYASFMAIVEISKNSEIFFGPRKKLNLEKLTSIRLPKVLRARKLAKVLNVGVKRLQFLNPSLRPHIFRRNYNIPRGFKLNIPFRERNLIIKVSEKLKKIKTIVVKKQKRTENHIVKRGESLYSISKLHQADINELMSLNNLSFYDLLFPGQEIVIKKNEESSMAKRNLLKVNRGRVHFQIKSLEDIFGIKKELGQVKDFSILSYLNSWSDFEKSFNFKVDVIQKGTYQFFLEIDETLGHYSDWSGSSLSQIMFINNLRNPQRLKVRQKIILNLTENKLKKFQEKRIGFHRKNYFNFMKKHEVSGLFEYVVRRGDTLEGISKRLNLPMWMIRRSVIQERKLNVGQIMQLPKVRLL